MTEKNIKCQKRKDDDTKQSMHVHISNLQAFKRCHDTGYLYSLVHKTLSKFENWKLKCLGYISELTVYIL